MRKTSLAHAKAHLSELVDAVEHRGKRILILRHGKPAAAIVPVHVVAPPLAARMSKEEAERLLDDLGSHRDPSLSAVEDLMKSRRATPA